MKKLTTEQKYASLKKQTEYAGMVVTEKSGKLVVTRKKKPNAKKTTTKSS